MLAGQSFLTFFSFLCSGTSPENLESTPQRSYFWNETRKRDDKILIIIQGVTAGVTKVARLPESCRFAFHEHPGAVSRTAYQGPSLYILSHGAFWVIMITFPQLNRFRFDSPQFLNAFVLNFVRVPKPVVCQEFSVFKTEFLTNFFHLNPGLFF